MKTIDETKDDQFKNLDKEKPKIPLYDDLPEKQQKEVFKKGEKEFAPQIKEQQDKMTKMVEEKLNPDNFMGSFKDIIPSGQMEGKVNEATEKFNDVKKLLSGGGIPNPLGGLF